MRKTLVRLVLVSLLGMVGILAFLWFTMPHHRIDRASFDKIAKGMSLPEVEALLHCRPGSHCSGSASVEMQRPDGSAYGVAVDDLLREANLGFGTVFWAGDNGVIVVVLDAESRVEEKHFANMFNEGLVPKVRRWLASIL